VDEGVAAWIETQRGDDGTVFAQQGGSRDPKDPPAPPRVALAAEHYGRIYRMLEKKIPVTLEINIENKFYDHDLNSFDILGEIPGTDKADEVVMLGAHFDSWQAGTGATDNGAGSAVMLEAIRILKASGLPMRRTVRIGLWTGEEEGLLGSRAYVKQHFGTAENPKPEWATLDCYFNVDTGTGRLRGASVFGPPEAAAMLRPVLAQFEDWGLYGVLPTSSRATGGTDSTSFNNAGLPGIGMAQDPIEYNSMTHHTNLDTYERIIPDDVKKAAAEIASAVWFVANRDQMVPRFAKDKMPAPVEPR